MFGDKKTPPFLRADKVNNWHLLTAFTKIERKDKIQYLMEQYHLSYSRIEDIITLYAKDIE